MKSVMISIKPQWCELIASGKKTVEVRKTRPKIDTPFKCYIYCTKDKHGWFDFEKKERLDGKAIGEFVCDRIDEFEAYKFRECGFEGLNYQYNPDLCDKSCLSQREIMRYGERKKVYGWHISDLIIYDEPKELSEFYRWTDYDDSKKDKRPCSYCEHNAFDYSENCEYCSIDYDGEHCVHLQMKRPPQSWCYVEERRY